MKEEEIRPKDLIDKYLELSIKDAEKYFKKERKLVNCVGCGGNQFEFAFEKNGFGFNTCCECGSLFQNPRPSLSEFELFYRDSVSSSYWAEIFFPAVAETRREKIFRKRVEYLSTIVDQLKIDPKSIMDVGAGYGIFLEEWRKCFPHMKTVAIEPSRLLADVCRSKNFDVVQDIVEEVRGYESSSDLVVCFEVLEHVVAPFSFIKSLYDLVRPGGFIFVSSLCVDGFDIQVLWEKSKSIFPPHHINFLSVEGLKSLFERVGFLDIQITTPGVLDVDIVKNAIRNDFSILEGDRFLKKLIFDDRSSASFQQFLRENKMSSHVWVMGCKPL